MGKKIVYIAMCADIVHKGHINILQIGAELGEVTVGLLTDEAISSYKEPPAADYQERHAVISALKHVQAVIPQSTLDYRPNLKKLKPDYVVHGTDWISGVQQKTRQQVMDLLNQWNGELVEPPYTEGISTSIIKKRIRSQTN